MKQTGTGEKKPIVLPCIAGLFCILAFSFIGALGPVFIEIDKGFGVTPDIFLPYIHWYWTFPLGCFVAGFLVRGSRRWPREKSREIDVIAVGLTFLLVLIFVVIEARPRFGPQ